MAKIYIVEDDDNIRELVSYALTTASFAVTGFAESTGFWQALKTSPPPNLLLLDIMLPVEDGISILQKLRAAEKSKKIPVILLTAKGGEYDKIKGLECGADDYVTKPFSVMELISRVKAVLRRCERDQAAIATLKVDAITLDKDKRIVWVKEQDVSLTYKEFELLYYLMLNEGLVLSRDKLMEQVWGVDFEGESRTVDMHIKTLRQKLGPAGDLIKTVRGVGYKMEAEV